MVRNPITSRLHRQIYFTIVVCLAAVVIASAAFFATVRENEPRDPFNVLARLTTFLVLPTDALPGEQQKRVEQLADTVNLGIALYGPDGTPIAAHGRRFPAPHFADYDDEDDDAWDYDHDARAWFLRLPDGRWFAADATDFRRRPPLGGLLLYFGLMIATIGLAAWPFVKRLTGRLERLQRGVEQIGTGDLSTRVDVEGRDEIAALATSFNTSARRIEALVNSNRQLLANASHELRTPLARVRLGVEMLKAKPDTKRQAALERDIAELDTLIDEILMMSRLDLDAPPPLDERVDLLALAAEECARYADCSLDGDPASVCGNTKLLRRLLRNLLDNAYKHGRPPVTIAMTAKNDQVVLTIADAGPGIAAEERERVFQPFHRSPGRQNVEGYGLGLALVAQIAAAHRGRIEIADTQESRFILTLPRG